nr:unnamed protein product [Callosobruchus chinensis]
MYQQHLGEENRSRSWGVSVRELQAESYQHKKETVIFVDLQKAYDNDLIYNALEVLDLDEKIIRLIKLPLQQTENQIKVDRCLFRKFNVKGSLRHVLEKVIRAAKINRSGLVYHKTQQCSGFADDVVIVDEVEPNYKNFEEVDRFCIPGYRTQEETGSERRDRGKAKKGNRCLYGLNGLVQNKIVSRVLKIRIIYKTVIRPVIS